MSNVNLKSVSTIQISEVNWGYFQLSQYLLVDVEFNTIENLFPAFVSTNFFAGSNAYIGERVENRKQGWESKTTYGRHRLVDISKLETRKYTYEEFYARLEFTVDDQVNYSLKYVELPPKTMDHKKQIMELITTFFTPDMNFYEIFVDDDRKYHEGDGAAIWDYFKSFIAIDRDNKLLYRVEHGRD